NGSPIRRGTRARASPRGRPGGDRLATVRAAERLATAPLRFRDESRTTLDFRLRPPEVSMAPTTDPWAEWLRRRRHGGDEETLERTLASLVPVRDRVLANAGVTEGQTLLDVGCGDGLIGFGALE